MSGGWYKHNRNLFERSWAKDSKMVAVYEYLHCCAYVRDQPYRDMIIRRGSCLTSRAAIMEGTGLSEHDVKSRLKKLLDNGEIIVNSSNLGTIITVCDYDGYDSSEDLFSLNSSSESPNGLPSESPNGLPSESPTLIYNKKEEYNNNLRSIPSKIEREKKKAVTQEIKKQFNKVFAGMLEEWQQVTDKMINKVELCIARFGRGSVDMVFEQVRYEQTNLNKNGFIPDFDFIFRIEQYERYLSRYKIRTKTGINKPSPQPTKSIGIFVDDEPQQQSRKGRREFLLDWIQAEAKNPSTRGQNLLRTCYESGELEKLGIDWKPNNE